jgi:hypothetical protein
MLVEERAALSIPPQWFGETIMFTSRPIRE